MVNGGIALASTRILLMSSRRGRRLSPGMSIAVNRSRKAQRTAMNVTGHSFLGEATKMRRCVTAIAVHLPFCNITDPGRMWIIDPTGKHLGTIPLGDDKRATNVGWGGDDRKT